MPKINPLQYVRSGITEGLSANQSYRNMLAGAEDMSDQTGDRWTGVRRDTFLQLWGSVRALREDVPEAIAAPTDLPGGGLSPVRRQANVPPGYLHWGSISVREVGSPDVEQHYYALKSGELLTPEQIADQARLDFEAAASDKHGSMFMFVFEGFTFTGVEELYR